MWVENVNRSRPTNFVPVKDSRICSEHFSADMFEEGHGKKAVLKPYAVPCVFKQLAQVGAVFCCIDVSCDLQIPYPINHQT